MPIRAFKRFAAAAIAVVMAGIPVGVASAGNNPAQLAAVPRVAAGPVGSPITLADGVQLHGYDVAIAPNGTVYIGWIATPSGATNRLVHLCVRPLRATACAGGVKTIATASSAAGLQVLAHANGHPASMMWFVDTDQSINGPFNSRIMRAHATSAGDVTPAQVYSAAPSFGSLRTAEVAPGGSTWVVLGYPSGTGLVVVNPGTASWAPTLPWSFHNARLAFAGTEPVLVIDRAGSVTEPLRVAAGDATGATWTAFQRVPRTWNVGGAFDVVTAGGGVHLVAPIDNASYRPTVRTWTGTAFGAYRFTGDTNSCHPASHDLVTDRSGRIADVSLECSKVTLANQPQRKLAALTRFGVGGTSAGGEPQIATAARGYGVVVWSRASANPGHRLLVTDVRLPALTTKRTRRKSAGKVTVTGPVSCMPVSTATIGVRAKPARAKGWRLHKKSLRLDGAAAGRAVNGTALSPGSAHRLVGRATFDKRGRRVTVTTVLTFTACPAD